MSKTTTFSFLDRWYTVEHVKTRYNEDKPKRIIVWDFSGVLVFTTTYVYDHEIDRLLQRRFGFSLQSKELDHETD